MSENIFANGMRWLKADFHLHTRSDKEFIYTQSEEYKKNKYPEDNTFANDYINKLVSENINIGVITNHNKFNKNEYVALKKKL